MPSLTYSYVYFAAGKHQRQPRSASGPGGFTLIQSIEGGTLASGDKFAIGAQPDTQQVGNQTYSFGFVSITGGTPSGLIGLDSNTPPPLVTVGSSPIVVLVVYVPDGVIGGPPGHDSGATIDSFNETAGALFSDTFVSVAPDQGGALTTSGNVYGWVDTWTSAETITALTPTSPTNVVFDRWGILGPAGGATISMANLKVPAQANVSALAFYKIPPPPPNNPAKTLCLETAASLVQMSSQGPDGPLFTTTEYAGVTMALQKCVLQGYLTQTYVKQLETQYAAYLAQHHGGGLGGGGGLGRPPQP